MYYAGLTKSRIKLLQMIRIFNTLTRNKEDFLPPRSRVNFFVCGPTVYGRSHIGHARTYITFDAIAKYLRSEEYIVNYLQNITDIDDKIINRAKESDITPQELSAKETENYLADMRSVKIDAVSKYAPASRYIPEIISQIERLIQAKRAYAAGGSVYFDIATFPAFGKLSRQNQEALQKAVRTEEDPNKKHAHDFVLWRGRAKNSDEPVWESPWGPGRPGWHIEDTAITEKEFGPQYDLHGGGIELIFPHHEAEIAQMESISSKIPFVKYWLHTGWVTVKGEKMSKSLGNFITIENILKKFSPEALRLLMLQTHYRSPLEYSEEQMTATKNRAQKLKEFRAHLRLIQNKKLCGISRTLLEIDEENETNPLAKFKKAMNDDFNTPMALGAFDGLIGDVNELITAKNPPTQKGVVKIFEFLDYVNKIFGILPAETTVLPEISQLAEKRETLRHEQKWDEADKIRDYLLNKGFLISDTPHGFIIIPK